MEEKTGIDPEVKNRLLKQLENGSIGELIKKTAELYEERDAFLVVTSELDIQFGVSYRDFCENIYRIAGFIRERFSSNKHIALKGANSFEWVCLYLGIIISGNIAVLLNKDDEGETLEKELKKTDSDIMLTSGEKNTGSSIPVYHFREFITEAVAHDELIPDQKCDSSRICTLIGTSGTTGERKYCMLTEKGILQSALNLCHAVPSDVHGYAISILPFFHSYSLSCGIIYQLIEGNTTVIGVPDSSLMAAINHFYPAYLIFVPSLLFALRFYLNSLSKEESNLVRNNIRTVFCGGAPLTAEMAEWYAGNKIELITGYGMTECAPIIAVHSRTNFDPYSVGCICKAFEYRIVDGELEVRGPQIMKGYYGDEKSTQAVFHDGWLRTGDLVRLDAQNRLIITGRRKNIIVLSNGENISPEEIENILMSNPGIGYCRIWGKENSIIVDIYSGVYSDDEVYRIVLKANGLLPAYKSIKRINILKTMPDTVELGKVKRIEY
ncbi:AMP-binding protein [Butyrivibrio sp. MC2013]|uniref:AMP-binding protein n=1 Tax=Butyrivibrio sp. MC2013 TaxID=1280686 RepID=UPI000417B17A|nr:AMP-binding protein [Butyrivibrio sp. MC2013]